MFIDFLEEINEKTKAEAGGRTVKARKSKVKVYDTIDAALKGGAPYGTIFSTKAADRLYVISKPTWGEKSRAGGNTRIAKGFTPGAATPSASWPSIKAHSVRTMLKHGKSTSKRLKKVYGAGKPSAEQKRYAGKDPDPKKKTNEAVAGATNTAEEKRKRRLKLKNPSSDTRVSAIIKQQAKSRPQINIGGLSKWNQGRLSRLAASTEFEGPFLREIRGSTPRLWGGELPAGLSREELTVKNQEAYRRLVASLKARKKQKEEDAKKLERR
mgnify:CR=1 FL=1